MASGPKLARARTSRGSPPSVTVPQHGHSFACATYSGDPRRRRRLDVGDLVAALRHGRLAGQALPAPAARRRREPEPLVRVIDQRIVVPGSPGCFPGRRFPRSRSDRSRPFFLYGLSDDGGLDDVDESLPACRSRSSTRAARP